MKDFKTKSRSIQDLDTPKSDFMALYNKERADRKWSKLSQHIAVKLHSYLKKNRLKQKDLAALMEVSPQQISKILSGKVNLTLETISKIESVTDLNIIQLDKANLYEDLSEKYLKELFKILKMIDFEIKSDQKKDRSEYSKMYNEFINNFRKIDLDIDFKVKHEDYNIIKYFDNLK